jgi:putative phosphoesterase
MRICFFSDVHGNIDAFHAFCNSIEQKNTDLLVFGGDFFGYFYYPNEIISEMRARDIRCILGNHDQLFLDIYDKSRTEDECISKYGSMYKDIVKKIDADNVDFLRNLPKHWELMVDQLYLGFFHGGPENPLNQRIYPDTVIKETVPYQEYDYIFVGHTHHKMMREVGNCKIINPGSIGQPRDGKGTSYVIFDTEQKKYKFYVFEYDRRRLLLDIEKNEGDNKIMKEKLRESILRVR